jgi:hypothetical protein
MTPIEINQPNAAAEHIPVEVDSAAVHGMERPQTPFYDWENEASNTVPSLEQARIRREAKQRDNQPLAQSEEVDPANVQGTPRVRGRTHDYELKPLRQELIDRTRVGRSVGKVLGLVDESPNSVAKQAARAFKHREDIGRKLGHISRTDRYK